MCPDPLVKRQVQNPGDGHNEGVEHLECKQSETGISGYPIRQWRPESELYCGCFVLNFWGVGFSLNISGQSINIYDSDLQYMTEKYKRHQLTIIREQENLIFRNMICFSRINVSLTERLMKTLQINEKVINMSFCQLLPQVCDLKNDFPWQISLGRSAKL